MKEDMHNLMSLSYAVLLIIASGGFGGLISVIFENGFIFNKKPQEYLEYWYVKYVCRVLIGIAGAFAIMFLGLWDKKLILDNTVDNKLFLISLFIVAGTFSDRFLPIIGIKGTNYIKKLLNERLEEQNTEMQRRVEKSVDTTMGYVKAISNAEVALSRETDIDVKPTIEAIEAIRKNFPMDRTIHIYLGRLYRKIKEYDSAIKILNEFIDSIEPLSSQNDRIAKNKAAALYNIACYYSLSAGETPGGPEKSRLISKACEYLKKSIQICPENNVPAEKDLDFIPIKQEPMFIALTKEGPHV